MCVSVSNVLDNTIGHKALHLGRKHTCLQLFHLISSKFEIILRHSMCVCVCVYVCVCVCHCSVMLTSHPLSWGECFQLCLLPDHVWRCCDWLQSTWWISRLLCICVHACECACTDVFCVCMCVCVSNFAKKASSSSWLTFQHVCLCACGVFRMDCDRSDTSSLHSCCWVCTVSLYALDCMSATVLHLEDTLQISQTGLYLLN